MEAQIKGETVRYKVCAQLVGSRPRDILAEIGGRDGNALTQQGDHDEDASRCEQCAGCSSCQCRIDKIFQNLRIDQLQYDAYNE